jgi:hypothetical protein
MGLEGMVSKRADRPYRAGRSKDWIEVKNRPIGGCRIGSRACVHKSNEPDVVATRKVWRRVSLQRFMAGLLSIRGTSSEGHYLWRCFRLSVTAGFLSSPFRKVTIWTI